MRITRHLGPTLLCAWVLWGQGESSGPLVPVALLGAFKLHILDTGHAYKRQ